MREIDRSGRSMSGGEQQKVAVSRAHMNDKPILIFDEPASMLDPLAEMEQFMNIKEKMQGNTAVLISHRVGFARLASKIFVLKDGRLAESGSHDELLAQDGEYARFFKGQAEWYRTDAVKGEVSV
jgi:ATP-binding cassette subfamily B protein